jgi:transposase
MVQEEGVLMRTRRRFTPECKARVVLDLIGGVKSLAEACRAYQLKPQIRARWQEDLLGKAPRVFQGDEQHATARARIAELERMVGRLRLALEGAKTASSLLNGPLGRSGGWS